MVSSRAAAYPRPTPEISGKNRAATFKVPATDITLSSSPATQQRRTQALSGSLEPALVQKSEP
eukprot:2021551-Rhodomonas_salina.3